MPSVLVNSVSEADFRRILAESDAPVLADFYADWCPPCRALAPTIDRIAEHYEGRVRVVKVNVDDARTLSGELGISSIPTLILFERGGESERIVGLAGEGRIREILDGALDR